MLICEIISVGDDNVLGKLLFDAKLNLKKIKNKENEDAIKRLMNSFEGINLDPGTSYNDGHTLFSYLRLLGQNTITTNKLKSIADTLGSYCNDSGD